MKKGRVIFFIVAIVLMAAIFYAYREYNRPNEKLTEIEPAVQITGSELSALFASNDSLANQQFLGKVIEVKGVIKNVETPEVNVAIIVIVGKETMSSVRCTMDSTFDSKSFSMGKGSNVTIKGICTGYNADELLGSDVLLNRCVIVNTKL